MSSQRKSQVEANDELEDVEKAKETAKELVWFHSVAKAILKKDLEEGRIPDSVKAREAYGLNPEFRKFPFKNFSTNFNNLRARVNKFQDSAAFDINALANDQRLYPPAAITSRGYPFWPNSEARRLLKADVDKGKHNEMTPQELHGEEPAYQVFPLPVFRQHIYQEVRGRKERAYWQHRKQNKKKK
jgi:hypothetical protein